MRNIKRLVAIVLTLILTLGMATINPVKAKAAGEPLPEELFTFDQECNMYVLTITDANKDAIAAYGDIHIVTNHKLVIATDFVISGDLDIDFWAAITVNKGCSVTANNVNISDIVTIVLGDKNCLTGLNLTAGDVKVKHTGDPVFYPFSLDDIDNTEFMKENGVLVYKDGPDCGINMNSNGTCKSEDGMTQYGEVYYEVFTNPDDVTPAYTGTLTEDWATVDMLPEKLKAGSRIDFTVKAYAGKVLQSNGVRFPDNKNYISTAEEEAKANTSDGCKCSYTFTENPDHYMGITVDFVDPSEVMQYAEFSWSYDSRVQEVDFDKYVSHGTIEVISAKKDGANVTNTQNPGAAPYWTVDKNAPISMDDPEGHAWNEMQARFEPGTKVKIRLVPDRGYQLVQFHISSIEGYTVAIDGVNEYEFDLDRPDFYNLSAVFAEIPDAVDVASASGTGVTGGEVTFDAGEISNGTMVLNVSSATPDATEMSTFNSMADEGGYEVAQCINLESEQRFYKGVENATRDQCWVINKSELSSPASITLDVSGITADEVVVLHNHNGEYETIDATYSNGQISFSAQSFSDFAIATKTSSGGSANPAETSTNDSKSSGDEYTYVAPAALGKTTSGVVIKNWEDMKKLLSTMPAVTTKSGKKAAASGELVELILNRNNTIIPAGVFKALGQSNAKGLHVFLGQGTALTFMNDSKISAENDVDVACKTSVDTGLRRKVIDFKTFKKLNSTVILHATVPAGTNSVNVYYTGSDGVRRKYGTFTPTSQGRMCFRITQLGKYEIEVRY